MMMNSVEMFRNFD